MSNKYRGNHYDYNNDRRRLYENNRSYYNSSRRLNSENRNTDYNTYYNPQPMYTQRGYNFTTTKYDYNQTPFTNYNPFEGNRNQNNKNQTIQSAKDAKKRNKNRNRNWGRSHKYANQFSPVPKNSQNNAGKKRKLENEECRLEFKHKRVCVNENKPLRKLEEKTIEQEKPEVIVILDSPEPSSAKFVNIKTGNVVTPLRNEKATISKAPVARAPAKIENKITSVRNEKATISKAPVSHTPAKIGTKKTENIVTPPKNEKTSPDLGAPVTSTPHMLPRIDKMSFINVWLEVENEEELETSAILNNASIIVNVDDNTLCCSNLMNDVPPENEKVLPRKSNDLAVIVDSHVFIYNIDVLENILSLKIEEEATMKPIIYMPWVVMGELDEIKEFGENKNLKKASQNAAHFIFNALSGGHPRFYGQSIREEDEVINLIRPKNETSDKIIGTVNQAAKKHKKAILLTNDANLKYKATVNNIRSVSPEEVIKLIKSIIWED